jgi:glyoxylase-like metal-dependent hydrolase (beta-lactamase superfamily II)/carbon monoxide dehydrogenase subunit G
MQFSGTEEIAAPREVTWAFLMDPTKVGSCGPGVQSIDVVDDDHFNARAKVGVGFITATFNVNMTFVERIPLEKARISARGQAPGSAVDAIGEMNLRDGPDGGTIMDWSADVNISGTLASVGARLIEGTAHKLIGQTFTCIKTKLQDEVASGAAAVAATPAAAAQPAALAMADTVAPATPAAPAMPATQAPTPARAAATPTAKTAPPPAPATTSGSTGPATRRGPLEFLVTIAGPAMTNVYVIGDPQTHDAVVIDPARPSLDWLERELRQKGWSLRLIIATHGHWDHLADAPQLLEWASSTGADGARIAVHGADRDKLVTPSSRTSPFKIASMTPAVDLVDGDRIVFGAIELEVLHLPGHTEGSIGLLTGSGGVLFSGDTLFSGAWGRTDMPGGNGAQMVESLRRLGGLPDYVRVFPGHGRSTTIGTERPWLEVIAHDGRLIA